MVAEHEASSSRKQREMDAAARLTFFFSLSPRPQAHGMVPPTFKWVFSTELTQSRNSLTDMPIGLFPW